MKKVFTSFTRSSSLSTSLRVAAASSLAILGLGLMGPAQAHDELVSSTPEQNSSLQEAPPDIELTYSGELTQVEGATQVRVTDSEGKEVTNGAPAVKGKTVVQKIAGHGTNDDTYTVTWRVVSSDGHPIQGSYELTVGEGAQESSSVAASQSAESTSEATEQTTDSNGVVKLGLFVLAGLVAFGAIVAIIAKTRRPQR